MVQQATSPTDGDVTSQLEALTPTDTAGDEPVIAPEASPVDLPVGDQGLISQESEASDPVADEAATDETDTTEAESESSAESESETPGDKSSYSKEEVNAIRSGMDKRYSELERRLNETESQYKQKEADLQSQVQAQTYAAQVAAFQSEMKQRFTDAGHTEADASRMAQEQSRLAEAAYQKEVENQRLSAQLNARTESEEATNARIAARELAAEHGVSSDDIDLLMGAKGVSEMTAMAKRLGDLNKKAGQVAEQKRAQIPAGANTELDSGIGPSGAMTDLQKYNAYGEGTLDLTLEEAMAIEKRLGLS